MKVNRLKDIKPYEAGGHVDMKGFRLQGHDASDLENFWVGLSYFLPGGGTTHTSTPLEKCYVCVGGAITIKTDNEEVTLENLDSIYLEPSESRSIINKSNEIATILVIMPYPEKA